MWIPKWAAAITCLPAAILLLACASEPVGRFGQQSAESPIPPEEKRLIAASYREGFSAVIGGSLEDGTAHAARIVYRGSDAALRVDVLTPNAKSIIQTRAGYCLLIPDARIAACEAGKQFVDERMIPLLALTNPERADAIRFAAAPGNTVVIVRVPAEAPEGPEATIHISRQSRKATVIEWSGADGQAARRQSVSDVTFLAGTQAAEDALFIVPEGFRTVYSK